MTNKNNTHPITPVGLERLEAELHELRFKQRPKIVEVVSWAASNGDRSENGDYIYGKRKLRELDRRAEYLAKRIMSAEVIDPLQQRGARVQFGATVTILNQNDEERQYTIVGADEIDIPNGRISYKSPVAKALMNKQEGDVSLVKKPAGEEELEILKVEFLAIL